MPEDMFDRQAARYDAWYETERGATILSAELSALRPLLAETGLCPSARARRSESRQR